MADQSTPGYLSPEQYQQILAANNGQIPSWYMPPEQIGQMYKQGEEYTKRSQSDEPMTSPWQGAERMVHALAGNMMRNGTGQQQAANTFGTGAQIAGAQPAGGPVPIHRAPFSAYPPTSSPQAQAMTPQPPPMTGEPPVGMAGSIPSAQPGGPPSAPPGLTSGMQLQGLAGLGGMGGGQSPVPWAQALMTQPPG